MDNHRSDHTVTDAMLEREIERALAVDPSPEFVARVRMRVASEPTSERWLWSRISFVSASAAAVLVAAVLMFMPHPPRVASSDAPLIAATSVGPTFLPLPSRAVPVRLPALARQRPQQIPSQAAPARKEPEVLIARDEAIALRRLLRNVNQGKVDLSALGDGLQAAALLRATNEIVVEPMPAVPAITIEPLESAVYVGGVRQ